MNLAGFYVFYLQVEKNRKLKQLQVAMVINLRRLSSATYI